MPVASAAVSSFCRAARCGQRSSAGRKSFAQQRRLDGRLFSRCSSSIEGSGGRVIGPRRSVNRRDAGLRRRSERGCSGTGDFGGHEPSCQRAALHHPLLERAGLSRRASNTDSSASCREDGGDGGLFVAIGPR